MGGGNNNWTNLTGAVNADYTQDSFAVFQGLPGLVTVSNVDGPVRASGMQFATGGYLLAGDALTLAGGDAAVNVGTGTILDGTITAVIDAELTGPGRLTKGLGGTLILNGANTYTGGTVVNGGTLQIASDANLGAAAGSVSLGNGTLRTVASIGSARAVDVAGTAAIDTDLLTSLELSGLLSGSGTLTKVGLGTLVLAGSGGTSGNIGVNAGTLLLNGNYAAGTGTIAVAAGAVLGGTGTIGGNVTMADVATLTPGGGTPGTLAINGSLSLSNLTVLDYQFGQPGGQGMSDLVMVGGDLVLDGIINVSETQVGSFGPGIHRVFTYGGALINNGLQVGFAPLGSQVTVQTSVANQVNLVNSAGLSLSFWDGALGPKNDLQVNGGSGIWQLGGGTNNWTDSTGAVNGDYMQNAFSIFDGTPGTVTVDNTNGLVGSAGMQFASDGYVVNGGAVTLVSPFTFIRVGEGTDTDAAMTATISAPLVGAVGLVKDLGGTLVLSGNNLYTGWTRIEGGTLQVSSDLNLGLDIGAVSFNDGTLSTTTSFNTNRAFNLVGDGTIRTAAGTTLGIGIGLLGGSLGGPGMLTKKGDGTLLLAGGGIALGGVDVDAGTLLVDSILVTPTVNVGSGASLGGFGYVAGDVVVGEGASLTPGSNGVGTLAIDGSLSLSETSILNYQFGQPYVSGGPLNDLVLVGDDLVLDGTINVTQTLGAVLAPGIYRVFDYFGSLTNRGLEIGSVPAGANVFVQTSVATQVNLVNSGGLQLGFWDGAGPKNNTAVDGGSGIWQLGGSLDNWTSVAGDFNGPYGQGSFAVFQGTAGTVTVDDGNGSVLAAGMQFAVDGYTLEGDAVTLTGPSALVHVGAFSAGDELVTANIDAELTGTARLTKDLAGTLVLNGQNTYLGGTTILGGTLRISADVNLGAGSGDLELSGGTLHTTGNIANTRTVVVSAPSSILVDPGTTLSLAGLLGGLGAWSKTGDGTLELAGFGGSQSGVTVSAGTLLVNGNYGAMAGTTTIGSGATLAGGGTLGGEVFLADGATLAPGGEVTVTLAIGGSLALSSGTVLNYQFGQPGDPLSGSNDLVRVGNALQLDGTINVSEIAPGDLGAGVHRIFTYNGTLANLGLDIGSTPAGTAVFVQTAVPGQVNLVNTAGLTLHFWDGFAGPKNDEVINGGAGTWQLGGGSNNWTDDSGSVNADYFQNSFAIFQAAPGVVTIDNGNGPVQAAGLQFASDGHVLTGDTLTLVGTDALIRVGHGSVEDVGFTAIIASEIAGPARLVKDLGGTLILTGSNGYTGGTLIEGGTLQIFGDENLGYAAGALTLAGGTLRTSAVVSTARSVEVAGPGTLLIDPGTELTLSGTLTGAGTITKDGVGDLVLAGSGAGSGGIAVNAGTLRVDGDYGAASGLATVASGATLRGSGSLGGDVMLLDGATLAPGGAMAPGALAVGGTLSLSEGSLINFRLGKSGVAGGALNDLVTVGADLVLDGTLNVAETPGGSFGPGVYRVFNYGGTLTDNGLTLGTRPLGSTVFVQTVIANQVNLVNTAGLVLRFWDGSAGPKNNGLIDGGSGVWQLAGGLDNWTEASGSVNADYVSDSFAIFQGAPGTVTVDNANGAVSASGLQFAASGFVVIGDALTLTGDDAFVNVGVGSAGDPAFTAAIEAELAGSARLVKDLGGTLILAGSNTYTGGTAINGGVLQISSDANLGDAAGSLTLAGGTLHTTADVVSGRALDLSGAGTLLVDPGTVLALGGTLTGAGMLIKDGAGDLVLAGTGGGTGDIAVNVGTLRVDGAYGAASGLTTVSSGAALAGSGALGGDVTLLDGATLAPGSTATPGTLAVGGTLTLSEGSMLNFRLGEAGVVGGALNDLVTVGGDLVLDGTLDVIETPGGFFGPGVYRVFNYGGTLTDNGLALGTTPAGVTVFVQTAVANQVNLVNTTGLEIRFWDGSAGPKNNGLIDGGSGVWQLAGGLDNWTDASGSVNAGYVPGGFAIFQGAPGTVTVDNGNGAVSASGLQFAASGFVVTGDALTLTGADALVRVGDGSAGDPTVNATIDVELAGTSRLVKDLGGTLILTGANTYTGGTAINGGKLQISSDANLGDAAGRLTLAGGTLQTTLDITTQRALDLAGSGTLLVDPATVLTLTGALAGAGPLTKDGAGDLVLAGTGGGAGGIAVNAGSLRVDGDYGEASGLTTIASGATLGGSGTLGGDVTLLDGATLVPGSAAASGTLVVGGTLSLSEGSQLNFRLGEAGTVGGMLNDLVTVGGDLVIDGTLNVTETPGGFFGPGIYRVFNYGGSLTDNGLALGTTPAGSTVFVQTAIANQVNLVNTNGLEIRFWDGASSQNNGRIDGGNGVWQGSAGNSNWILDEANIPYADGAFVVFTGQPGTVEVDTQAGPVITAGMQFATDGYTITGDDLTLLGPAATVRVGDGTTAGADYVATISAGLTGDAQLVKTDAGTLILSGNNSYTGGTAINGGTLQISEDANLGAAGTGLTINGGTLATAGTFDSDRDVLLAGPATIAPSTGTTLTLGGELSGTGALTKADAGTLRLTGDSSAYTSPTTIAGGTLAVDGKLGGPVTVNAGTRLEGSGQVGAVTNTGTIAPGGDGGFGTLTVAGLYTGNGGTLQIDTVLAGDTAQTDRLVIGGGTTGATNVAVTNRGGMGAPTSEGIKIVDVTGGASAGTFTLDGDYSFGGRPTLIAGAFGYQLVQGGVSTPADGDWYLRSSLAGATNVPVYQPGVPIYEGYGANLQALSGLSTFQQRIGNRSWAAGSDPQGFGIWGQIEGTRSRANAAVSTSFADQNINGWKLRVGAEAVVAGTEKGEQLVAGVMGYYGEADSRIRSIFGNGSIETHGHGVGGTLSWFGLNGFYVDGQAQFSWFESDLNSAVLGNLVDDNEGKGKAFSLEVGKRTAIGGKLSVTPQLQMVYTDVKFDRFVDPAGAVVATGTADSLRTRWGISIDRQSEWDTGRSHVYALANLTYEWLDGSRTLVSGTPIEHSNDRLWAELGVGGSVTVGRGLTFYGEVSGTSAVKDFGEGYSLRANAGVRMAF